MQSLDTFIALNRFGLGYSPQNAAAAEPNPRAWVKSQIKTRQKIPEALTKFRRSATITEDLYAARMRPVGSLVKRTPQDIYREDFTTEVTARARHMISTPEPFAERMVQFWSNHFTVSSSKPVIAPLTPAFEREAIRPHIFGKFSHMLKAVTLHPVMLSYLDNDVSVGTNSWLGIRRRFQTGLRSTLNENLAREILELHTIGVNGGYTQDDVVELAKALTGWSHGNFKYRYVKGDAHGGFEFIGDMHEPGRRKVLGKSYKNKGVKTGMRILEDLATHASTAQHIATKLVRHFVSDDPPIEAISQIAIVFVRSGGNLAEVSRALVDLNAVWQTPMPKIKSHYELVISAYRAAGKSNINAVSLTEPLREFGQIPFSAGSPAGWPDQGTFWIAPESLMRRVEWLRKFASGLPPKLNPEKFMDELIGPVVSDATRRGVANAPSKQEALSLILASPEFQRR